MGNREHDLIQELRAALLELERVVEAEAEAKREVVARRTVRHKVELLVREIQEEITTGKRRDPLIEYIETADERQRGPTAEPAPTDPKPKPKRKREREPDVTDRAIAEANRQSEEMRAIVERDLNKRAASLRLAVSHSLRRDDFALWDEYEGLGEISDSEVVEALQTVWGPTPTRFVSVHGEYVVRGGDKPALWFPASKNWSSVVVATLADRELCEAVRRELNLSEAETEPEPAETKGGAK